LHTVRLHGSSTDAEEHGYSGTEAINCHSRWKEDSGIDKGQTSSDSDGRDRCGYIRHLLAAAAGELRALAGFAH
jgi:hypothetical protein